MERRRIQPGKVTGLGQPVGVALLEVVHHALRRCHLAAAAGLFGGSLELFLEYQTRQHPVLPRQFVQVLGLDGGDHAGIGEGGVPAR